MRMSLVLSLAILLLVLLAGCRTQPEEVATVAASLLSPPAPAANTPYVELTYPQSDDQGHYVGLPKAGDVTLSGIVAALKPPTRVVVNGVSVQPYAIEDVAPFGTPAGYSAYGFSLPMEITPTTLLSIALQALGVTTPAVAFAPDGTAVYSRLVELARAAPKVPVAQYRLANALLARQRYNDAIAAYRRSIALQPQFVWGYDGLGQTYVLMQRPADAVIQFKKAKKLKPKWAYAYYRLAEAYTSQKRYDDAVLAYREGLRFAPSHPGLHRGYAVALYNRGNYREAWNHVRMAEKGGAKPPPGFEKRLRERMPEPPRSEMARDRGGKQTGRDQKRQDGVRRSGPHPQSPADKPQKRQDGVRESGPHAQNPAAKHQERQDGARASGPHESGQKGKHSKGD